MLVEKYDWATQKSLFAETNQDSTFSHTRENLKMFNITSKYFSFFNNKITCRLSQEIFLHVIPVPIIVS